MIVTGHGIWLTDSIEQNVKMTKRTVACWLCRPPALPQTGTRDGSIWAV